MPAGSLDRWPQDYERGRPGWPRAVVDVAGLPPTACVLDLGAGTGKLTRLLVGRFDRVVAVEPAQEMRRLLATLSPEAEALAGTAQEIPLADAAADAVFAAESFHWFDDERALTQIARVLRPGGALVLMWNLQLQEARLPNPQTLDREGLVAFFASMGWLGDLPDEDRLPLLEEVRLLLAAGEYRRLWETHLYWTRLPATPPERLS